MVATSVFLTIAVAEKTMKNKRIKSEKDTIKFRRTWIIHPETRIKESVKIYNRSAEKQKLDYNEDYDQGDNDYYE
jgi:hypothetical protein